MSCPPLSCRREGTRDGQGSVPPLVPSLSLVRRPVWSSSFSCFSTPSPSFVPGRTVEETHPSPTRHSLPGDYVPDLRSQRGKMGRCVIGDIQSDGVGWDETHRRKKPREGSGVTSTLHNIKNLQTFYKFFYNFPFFTFIVFSFSFKWKQYDAGHGVGTPVRGVKHCDMVHH